MNLIYAVKRCFKMDTSRIKDDISRVSEKSGKSKAGVFFDMLWCGLRYGAGPLDYELFEFYDRTGAQRKTYITRGVNNTLVKKYNDKSMWHFVDNKNEFNKTFCDYIHRDWLFTDSMTKDDFIKFADGKESFIYKPIDGMCGKGIEKINLKGENIGGIYEDIKSKPRGVIEEIISQHSALSKVYPLSINTIRVVTILKDGEVTPICAFWRMGNNGNFVDNLNSGGMSTMLDIKTGEVLFPAADKNGKTYTDHPYTGERILGFKMPMWEEVINEICSAAKVVPQIGYVGWDVALSENSVQLIEGNCFPGHDILQLPVYTPDKKGMLPKVEKFLK